MERCDIVNDNLRLLQDTEGLTFGTDALLLAGYVGGQGRRGCELGAGSGIISLLLLSRGKLSEAVALEVQPHYAELTKRNAEENGLSERLTAVCCDIRDYKSEREFELVYSNPPYMKVIPGKENASEKKNIARHEVMGGIEDFCSCAARVVKFGGDFACVYRPDRLCDLLCAMRGAGLEPKRMTMVHADTDSEPSMVLVEAKRGGKSGMTVTSPLIIYSDSAHREYTADMKYIMENGSFPDGYRR